MIGSYSPHQIDGRTLGSLRAHRRQQTDESYHAERYDRPPSPDDPPVPGGLLTRADLIELARRRARAVAAGWRPDLTPNPLPKEQTQ